MIADSTEPGSTPWLQKLNPEQRLAVMHGTDAQSGDHGPLLVIAGAGSGKTNTLAHRVAYLIVEGADPPAIQLRRPARLCRAHPVHPGLDPAALRVGSMAQSKAGKLAKAAIAAGQGGHWRPHARHVAVMAGIEPADVEVALYGPVKRFLETLGFLVKGEIGGCDLVGLRDDNRVMVIGELKLRFNLELVLQGVDRTAACDEVWLAVRTGSGRQRREADARVRKLCRMLGFGLLGVRAAGKVDVIVPCGPWRPRPDPKRRSGYSAGSSGSSAAPTL